MAEHGNRRRKTRTSDEIEALLRDNARSQGLRTGGRIARAVESRLRTDTGLRRRIDAEGLEAWTEDDGRVPRWFIGAAAAAVLAAVGWVALGPAGPGVRPGPATERQPMAEAGGAGEDGIGSVSGRLLDLAGAEPLRREARALIGVAGELAERVIVGVPPELLRMHEVGEEPASEGSSQPTSS